MSTYPNGTTLPSHKHYDFRSYLIHDPKQVDLRHANLDTIETAVEDWRKQALPEIEAHLLGQAQSVFTAGEKTS